MTLQDKVQAYCEAIHSQDEKEFEALWSQTENCTLISIGNVYHGYASIYQDFLIGGIQKAYASIILIPEEIAVTYESVDYAIVTFRYHTECIRREDGSPHGIAGVETQVWKKEDDWRMIHLHYSKV